MVVQAPPLLEQLGLRRVQVFGAVIGVHCPATESDAPPARIADRKHDPIAKRVIGVQLFSIEKGGWTKRFGLHSF